MLCKKQYSLSQCCLKKTIMRIFILVLVIMRIKVKVINCSNQCYESFKEFCLLIDVNSSVFISIEFGTTSIKFIGKKAAPLSMLYTVLIFCSSFLNVILAYKSFVCKHFFNLNLREKVVLQDRSLFFQQFLVIYQYNLLFLSICLQ